MTNVPKKSSVDLKLQNYVNKFRPVAISATQGTAISPDTVLTVSAVESAFGNSTLAAKYNNFFGYKTNQSWKGRVINLPTHEYINGKLELIHADFKWYDSPLDSFKDYVHEISSLSRYKKVLQTTDPAQQFKALQAGGYSTNPNYAKDMLNELTRLKQFFTPANAAAILIFFGVSFFFIYKFSNS